MKVDRRDDDFGVVVQIFPLTGKEDHVYLEVGKREALEAARWRAAGINWPAIGTVDPDTAEQFANGILEAVKIARQLDLEKPTGKAVLS